MTIKLSINQSKESLFNQVSVVVFVLIQQRNKMLFTIISVILTGMKLQRLQLLKESTKAISKQFEAIYSS